MQETVKVQNISGGREQSLKFLKSVGNVIHKRWRLEICSVISQLLKLIMYNEQTFQLSFQKQRWNPR